MELDDGSTKATVCKTISRLLPNDLDVKRACQLTEFLLEPTVDAYYAVETLYNEPDQKVEEERMPVPNSLRCELLLVFKTQWPFDPEFWDWRTLKRHCLALMGEEASIVSSIDLLNDTEEPEDEVDFLSQEGFQNIPDHLVCGTYELTDVKDRKQKNREMKKLREKGFISARFRNWQAYMQYCVLCDKEFLGHRIVRHAQTHLRSGEYSCPICAQTFTSKDILIPHVTSHVKQSCKERLTALKTNKKLTFPKTATPVLGALKAKTENELNENAVSHDQNIVSVPPIETRVERCSTDTDDNVCPVGKCKRSFKFFKNLVAHVKAHGDDEEAKTFLEIQSKKVVCQYCRRHFVSVTHLNDHLQVHCGVKPYICIQLNCKASFLSNTELLIHRKTHTVFKARCMFPNCGKTFNEAFKLYDHEAQHYKTFTCKVVDCGKVFHSQKQLDLHKERHATPEDESSSSELKPQNMQPAPPLIEQMLTGHTPVKPETSPENLNTKIALNPDNEQLPTSIESLLEPSQVSEGTLGQHKARPEPQISPLSTSQTHTLDNFVIQPANSHLSDVNRHCSFNYARPPHSHNYNTDMSHQQPQMFHAKVTTGPQTYSSDCNLLLPGQQKPISSSNLSTVLPLQNSIGPAISQLLPATVTQQPLTGNTPENPLTTFTSTGLPSRQRERFHCAFETCARHYSSYRSVTKHMKTDHTEFYEQWKVTRAKIKVTYTSVHKTQSVGLLGSGALLQKLQGSRVPSNQVQRLNVIQSPPYVNMGTCTKFTTIDAPSSSGHNCNASVVMENVLDPIVLSQLGSDTNPHTQKWHSTPGKEQTQHCGSSYVYPSDMPVMPQVDTTSSALPLNIPLCSMMGAAINRPAESLRTAFSENGSQSILPPYIDGAKEMAQQPYTSQMQSSLVSDSNALEKIKSVQKHAHVSFTSQDSSGSQNHNNQPQNGPVVPENDPEFQKRAKRNKRTKWPAIIRDGKFICCRCFRQFNSPKSLGGHLSKRAICKPYDESELNTDLPTSFLDLLNSEQVLGTAQSHLSYNSTAVYQEKPQRSVGKGSTAETINYPSDNLLVYRNGESNGDMITHISAESNMSDCFVQTPAPQPLFQNPCVPYDTDERLPGSSVIQHTENVQLKQEGPSYSTAHYPQPSIETFAGSAFPDPLLSHILTENPTTAVPRRTNHNERGNSETKVQAPDPESKPLTHTQIPDNLLSPPIIGRLADTQRKTTEQEIKKRLREQILAGDFQRRTSLCHSSITDPKNPMSSGSMCSPSNNSELHHMSHDAKGPSIIQEASTVTPGPSREIEHLLNTQSFTCFRETSTPQLGVPSPSAVVIHNADLEPRQLSASQQQWMTEIQSAFERLALVREISDHMSVSMKLNSNTVISRAGSAKVELRSSVSSKSVKPFACENENCTFSSMSSEALWRHLNKSHNYTLDMVNVVKKRYGQYAPFKCQKCSKTFTRNSNLRAHYHSAHKLSTKEIEDLDMKRREAKAATIQKQASAAQTAMARHCSMDNQALFSLQKHNLPFEVPCVNMDLTKNYQDDSHLTVSHPLHSAVRQTNGPPPLNKQPAISRQVIVKPSMESSKKTKEKKPNCSEAASPYRPYRCVHQGCVAAFTIQQNLILHYRAVHQTALSALEVNKDQDHPDGQDGVKNDDEDVPDAELPQISEFRCQVKDCSRVFQEIPSLLQHYLQLHEFGLDKVGILLSGIRPGKFTCDHQGCTAFFTNLLQYICHIKELHKDMLAKPEHLNGLFKCEIEGCDRSYATKSNMLRHAMKKHQDLYQPKLRNPRLKEDGMKPISKALHYQIPKTSNGKENIESYKKILQRANDKKRDSKEKNNHWTKYGKPSLKSKLEASSMCTKKFPLQYPCMIKGCESVMKSERSILKHYMGHGLSEKYLEQQRSHFIFCKKFPRQKCHSIRSDDSKSENSDLSDELTADNSLEAQFGYSKPVLRKRTTEEIPAALFDSKLSNDESSDGSQVLKRKRGRPRKLIEKIVRRKKIPRTTKIDVVYSRDDESDSSCPVLMHEEMSEQSAPLASFKPMGFEMSFLKFLEQSNKCEHSLATMVDVPGTCGKRSTFNTQDTCVRFRNRHSLKYSKIKIIIDRTFSGVADLMLKQLQDMQPTVVLGKNDLS